MASFLVRIHEALALVGEDCSRLCAPLGFVGRRAAPFAGAAEQTPNGRT